MMLGGKIDFIFNFTVRVTPPTTAPIRPARKDACKKKYGPYLTEVCQLLNQ